MFLSYLLVAPGESCRWLARTELCSSARLIWEGPFTSVEEKVAFRASVLWLRGWRAGEVRVFRQCRCKAADIPEDTQVD